jgi:transcriptional regulator GlxA family with amidase domain
LILANPASRFTLEGLAKEADMNANYFTRAFKKLFRKSPKEYMIQTRIDHAAYLLRNTNMQIKQIAKHLGYEDPAAFSKQFGNEMKESPVGYRNK